MNKAFMITKGKGFRVTFANGWACSVQFGPGNYCEHYDDSILKNPDGNFHCSVDAECAVIDPSGNLIPMGERGFEDMFGGDDVAGRLNAEQMLRLMVWAEKQEVTK